MVTEPFLCLSLSGKESSEDERQIEERHGDDDVPVLLEEDVAGDQLEDNKQQDQAEEHLV